MELSEAGIAARLRTSGSVFADDEARLLVAHTSGAELAALVERRAQGEPLEALLGWAMFAGMRLSVAPGVFVPRMRTELLVDLALAGLSADGVVAELCCGVAPVGAAVLRARPDAEVWAVDLDPDAVAVARRNLPLERVLEGDLFAPLPQALRARINVIVANAPYVPSAEIAYMPSEARDYEHRMALDGGADGLAVQARIAEACRDWLAPDGRVVIETSARQAPRTAELFAAAGLRPRIVHDDERDATAVVATLSAG